MIDIKLIREERELVKENIKKKFQDKKLPLVDEVIELDELSRKIKTEADAIRAENPRGAPTCTCLPTSGPKPPARDPLPALPPLLTHICAAHLHTLCT